MFSYYRQSRTPFWAKYFYPNLVWRIPVDSKKIFLTFDDGPISEVTPWVLNQLNKYNAKATFFCIGDNIEKNGAVFQQVIDSGNAIGNHTFNHLNGWKTNDVNYIANTIKCTDLLLTSNYQFNNTVLFRPPYGKIKKKQIEKILALNANQTYKYKIIMWDLLSYDFDTTLSPEKCLSNLIKKTRNGSIVVFHDSLKAFPILEQILPLYLSYLHENKFEMCCID